MPRVAPWVLLALLVLVAPAQADDQVDRWGVGTQLGWQKLVGGERDYSNVDQALSLWLRRGTAGGWSWEGGLHYGWVRPGALKGEDAGLTTGSVHAFYTTTVQGMVGGRHRFGPGARVVPYLGLYAGCLDWRVHDENGVEGVGATPDGPLLSGYDESGDRRTLHGRHLTGTIDLGLEWFVGGSSSLAFGARLTRLFGNDLDNIGSGNLWGPREIDVNDGLAEAYAGLSIYWGGDDDRDDDGVLDAYDVCPDVPEDPDGWQDRDGCPELDNDGDGVIDSLDACPNDDEDRDGYRDDDGCPDPDNDGDGVVDAKDRCPDQAEDQDGFEDQDGCPDADNDGDGVIDTRDRCPGTPAGVRVGADGCPEAAELKATMTLRGVRFRTGSAVLEPTSATTLDGVAASLLAWPQVRVEIQGHTDDQGAAEANRDLSLRRAEAVRQYLIAAGVAAERLTAVGYGEDMPIADNTTESGRAANRRVELVRTDR